MIYSFIKHIKILNSLHLDLIYFFSVNPRDWLLFLITKLFSKIRRIPVVYDYFISKFQTFYEDRMWFSRKNRVFKLLKYAFLFCVDYFECLLSDRVILDTKTHIKYFNLKFRLKKEKFYRIFIGAEPIFKAKGSSKENKDKKGKIRVGFWGTYIPLHGIEYIIKAAQNLKDDNRIIISLLGKGQTYTKNYDLAKALKLDNVEFLDMILLNKLPDFISSCDIGLGIFGKGEKSLCVIPNKIYEAIKMRIPLITANTPAVRELFTHKKNIYLCQKANPKSLSDGILELINNKSLRYSIADNAYHLYKDKTSLRCIAKDLADFFLEL